MTSPADSPLDGPRLDSALGRLAGALLTRRGPEGAWTGELSSSALSTATAVTALAVVERASGHARHQVTTAAGLAWLARHQNADGGWGDTIGSPSNLSTTTLAWAAFGAVPGADGRHAEVVGRAGGWLRGVAGGVQPEVLGPAIVARYGKDRTFSVPILTHCALAGRLGEGRAAWRHVLPLPFELAALPHRWFAALRMPVVSYALPALIAMGQARHVHRPTRHPLARLLRLATRNRTLRVLEATQPTNGGFLEATPLTSFVTMSLAGSGQVDHRVTARGVEFLLRSQRADGSWPIDTNLATWVTTLAVGALGPDLPTPGLVPLAEWLLGQQCQVEHPYTHAPPGGWAWTPLPGGVPDADDTSGALLALQLLLERAGEDADLGRLIPRLEQAWQAGARWLAGLQNRDGGVPTFCRGWGTLPFDRSSPDITAHALRAWQRPLLPRHPVLADRLASARQAAEEFLVRSQETDGSWVPLWFGNQQAEGEVNKVYGTSRVLLGLAGSTRPALVAARRRGVEWLCRAQGADGAWGGGAGPGSVEETGLAMEALGEVEAGQVTETVRGCLERGGGWLLAAEERGHWEEPTPIGLYFARLWYHERLYPWVFGLAGLRAAARRLGRVPEQAGRPI